MEPECYPSSIMPHSSQLFLDYTESRVPLAPFYAHAASGLEWITQGRALTPEHRARLADLLAQQNESFGGGVVTSANIERLRAGASAVVTGQQVGLFGGPLYTLLKAATAIERARQATQAGVETVPIFWLASEDHDFAEIDHVDLPGADGLGPTLEHISIGPAPETPVPVGGIPLGPEIEVALHQAEAALGGSEVLALLRRTYLPRGTLAHGTLAQAFGSLLAQLFARWGLVVLDAAGRDFHALGASVLAQSIVEADALHVALQQRNTELAARGYHAQVLVGEQSSLLFLMDESNRGATAAAPRRHRRATRSGRPGGGDSRADELVKIVQVSPERLSPNALLRPVFQDAILPTSAYVGGPAEIAYFAQSEVLYRSPAEPCATAVLPRLSGDA